jgi:hypothetical protein
MSYPRIQQVLEADSMFVSQVANKDTTVTMRSGEKVQLPSLVVRTYDALKAAGCNMQSVARTTILAAAARLSSGEPLPYVAPAPPKAAPKAAKKAAEPPRAQQSTTKPVVVTTTRAGAPRPIVVEKHFDTDVIHRYQCAVASAQLLAALHQLFEKDDFPGHELRKKKLDDLITEVEQASSQHVNLSVKAIIRAQTTTKHQATG